MKQADDSTPMHMVCAQGNLEIIKLMFDIKKEQAKTSLSMFDKENRRNVRKLSRTRDGSIESDSTTRIGPSPFMRSPGIHDSETIENS